MEFYQGYPNKETPASARGNGCSSTHRRTCLNHSMRGSRERDEVNECREKSETAVVEDREGEMEKHREIAQESNEKERGYDKTLEEETGRGGRN